MKSKVGMWIDHRKAVVVAAGKETDEVMTIESNVEKQIRRSDDVNIEDDSFLVPTDGSQLRTFNQHINVFYDKVISSIGDAHAVLIFGPGDAKGEIKKRIEEKKLSGRIIDIETVDKMTDNQIAAKVRKHFDDQLSG